jgi:predicted membrane chloride channel (bestrophin family)
MLNKLSDRLSLNSRWKLALKTVPFVIAIVFFKFAAHYFSYEFLTLNSLFTAIISANIFLIGFLISGTLVDYKESEKIPGDLSASLEALADEGLIIYKNKKSQESIDFLCELEQFCKSLIDWFYKKERTENILKKLLSFNNFFLVFEGQTQANFIVRMKQEQNTIRKMINRIHTIRETSFLGSGYAIVEIITSILVFGLVFIKMDPFYESIFFVSFVSFILIYMIYFIKDIDNPFGYNVDDNLVEDVSLKPIFDTCKRLESYNRDLGAVLNENFLINKK